MQADGPDKRYEFHRKFHMPPFTSVNLIARAGLRSCNLGIRSA